MVGYPGAQRPVFEPVAGRLPPPGSKPRPASAAAPADDDGPQRSRRIAAIVAVVAAVAVGAAVFVVSGRGEQAAPTTTVDWCQPVAAIVAGRPQQRLERPVEHLIGLVVQRDGTSEELFGAGAVWPDDGRGDWDSALLSSNVPAEWALRRADDGVTVMVQRFAAPGDASGWDRAGLYAACAEQLTVTSSPAAPGAASVSSTSETSQFAQVSFTRGQYRVVVWSYAPDPAPAVERAALDASRHLNDAL